MKYIIKGENINNPNFKSNKKKYNDIEIGEFFLFENDIYIKTENCCLALNVSNGKYRVFRNLKELYIFNLKTENTMCNILDLENTDLFKTSLNSFDTFIKTESPFLAVNLNSGRVYDFSDKYDWPIFPIINVFELSGEIIKEEKEIIINKSLLERVDDTLKEMLRYTTEDLSDHEHWDKTLLMVKDAILSE